MKRIPQSAIQGNLFEKPYFLLITYKVRKGERLELSKPTPFSTYETMKQYAFKQVMADRRSAIPVIAYAELCAYDKDGPFVRETMK